MGLPLQALSRSNSVDHIADNSNVMKIASKIVKTSCGLLSEYFPELEIAFASTL